MAHVPRRRSERPLPAGLGRDDSGADRGHLAVADPRGGTYPLPATASGSDGCRPSEAIDRIPPGGAFIFGWEYGQLSARLGIRPRDFPPRPAHFRLANLGRYECMGRSYMIRFSDRGWAFQIHVYLGPKASAVTRATVLRVLDSFHKT